MVRVSSKGTVRPVSAPVVSPDAAGVCVAAEDAEPEELDELPVEPASVLGVSAEPEQPPIRLTSMTRHSINAAMRALHFMYFVSLKKCSFRILTEM